MKATRSVSRTVPADAEAQLASFIGKFEPAQQRLICAVRKALRARLPSANELAYDNYNFFRNRLFPNGAAVRCHRVHRRGGKRSEHMLHPRRTPSRSRHAPSRFRQADLFHSSRVGDGAGAPRGCRAPRRRECAVEGAVPLERTRDPHHPLRLGETATAPPLGAVTLRAPEIAAPSRRTAGILSPRHGYP